MAILQMMTIDAAKKVHAAAVEYHKGKAAEHEAHLKRLEMADTPIEQLPNDGIDKLLSDIEADIQGERFDGLG